MIERHRNEDASEGGRAREEGQKNKSGDKKRWDVKRDAELRPTNSERKGRKGGM